jgi:hypothetical protein
VKDEKPEDKKKNDEAFAADKKRLEEKLANEKKSEGWVYEVTEYTVSSLLKKRAEILAAPPKADAPAAAATGQPAGGLPDIKKMIPGLGTSVVTPALSVPASPLPPTPKTELKPAPAPDANPLPGVKPAAPAPASEPAKPAAAPAKPVEVTTKPLEVTTKPVEVTTKPVEAVKATEPAKPAADSSK